MVSAFAGETRAGRLKKLAAVEAEVERRRDRLKRMAAWPGWLARAIHDYQHHDVFADAVIEGEAGLSELIDEVDRQQMQHRLQRVALGVAGYRAEHGEYPATLNDLLGDWLGTIPKDVFNGAQAVQYRLSARKVRISSHRREWDAPLSDLMLEWRR